MQASGMSPGGLCVYNLVGASFQLARRPSKLKTCSHKESAVNRWRWAMTLLLLALVGVPLAMPFVAVARVPSGWAALEDTGRLTLLARNTLLLVAGTLALA